MSLASAAAGTAIAVALSGTPDREGFPQEEAWRAAPPIVFNADWRGENTDPLRETEVRMLWTRETLYVQFRCRYRNLTVFPDSEPNGRRYELWDRDVAEVFLQPDGWDAHRYWEFEISPNGMWIDLDIAPGQKGDPHSGMRSRVKVDEAQKTWTAVIALPTRSLTEGFDPSKTWRLNFFRVEGPGEPRFYSSWQPTHTPQPNFHVPAAFGKLRFE